MRIGIVEVLIGGNLTAVHRQGGLDQADDAGRRLEMAEVRFGRADQQRILGLASPAVDRAEGTGLNGIAEQCPGAMRLDVADLGGLHAGVRARGPQHGGLRCRIGGHQTVGPAVLVDRRSAHDREDPVTVAHRVGEPFEHGDTAPLAADESVGSRVEGVACAGGRHGLGPVEAPRHHR